MPIPQYVRDPESVLDYIFDWTAYLAVGETISTFLVTAATGLTLNSSSQTGGVVTAWVSGGTVGAGYLLECKVTTSAGRTDERSMKIRVDER